MFGAQSVADGMQVETSQQSRATVVASDSALALSGREFFPDLRQGVPEDAQVEIAGQPFIGVAEPRTPETVVDVFPMTDDAPAEIPQFSARPRCRTLVLVPQPPGGTPASIQERDADSTDSLPGVELGEMVDGANSVDGESHRASVMRTLRETVLETGGHATSSVPR